MLGTFAKDIGGIDESGMATVGVIESNLVVTCGVIEFDFVTLGAATVDGDVDPLLVEDGEVSSSQAGSGR